MNRITPQPKNGPIFVIIKNMHVDVVTMYTCFFQRKKNQKLLIHIKCRN